MNRVKWFAVSCAALSLTASVAASGPVTEKKQAAAKATSASAYRVIGVGDMMLGSDYPIEYLDPRVTDGGDPTSVLGQEMTALYNLPMSPLAILKGRCTAARSVQRRVATQKCATHSAARLLMRPISARLASTCCRTRITIAVTSAKRRGRLRSKT